MRNEEDRLLDRLSSTLNEDAKTLRELDIQLICFKLVLKLRGVKFLPKSVVGWEGFDGELGELSAFQRELDERMVTKRDAARSLKVSEDAWKDKVKEVDSRRGFCTINGVPTMSVALRGYELKNPKVQKWIKSYTKV